MITTTTALTALLLTAAQAPQTASVPTAVDQSTLEAERLANGRAQNAIAALKEHVADSPQDPALLINLGIAHAQAGEPDKARVLFERALVSPKPIELETADGDVIDSRRLARKAMRMLERGEFTTQLSRRD